MDQTINMELLQEKVILELIALLRQNQRKDTANDIFEMAVYIDSMEKKLNEVFEEIITVKKQLVEMQENQERKSLKESLSKALKTLEQQCQVMKEQLFDIKVEIKTKAAEIVKEVKQKGKRSLNRVGEFLGIKQKLEKYHKNVHDSIVNVDKTIAKIDAFGKGMRETTRQAANTFRTFADKEPVDYSKEEKDFSKTEIVKGPWKVKRALLLAIESRLDAAIYKITRFSKNAEQTIEGKHSFEEMGKEVAVEGITIKANEINYRYGSEVFDTYKRQEASEMMRNQESDLILENHNVRSDVHNIR